MDSNRVEENFKLFRGGNDDLRDSSHKSVFATNNNKM